jgi:hypothetical protein
LWEELGAEFQVNIRKQVKGHNCSFAQVSLEQVLLQELNAVSHTGFLSIFSTLLNKSRINLYANAPSAEFLCGGNHNPPIATAQVVEEIITCHQRLFKHFLYNCIGCWHIRHVRKTFLRSKSGCGCLGLSQGLAFSSLRTELAEVFSS